FRPILRATRSCRFIQGHQTGTAGRPPSASCAATQDIQDAKKSKDDRGGGGHARAAWCTFDPDTLRARDTNQYGDIFGRMNRGSYTLIDSCTPRRFRKHSKTTRDETGRAYRTMPRPAA